MHIISLYYQSSGAKRRISSLYTSKKENLLSALNDRLYKTIQNRMITNEYRKCVI